MRHYKDIAVWQDVTAEQWEDWKWQVRNRIRTLADLQQIIRLTPDEVEGVRWATMDGHFPLGIDPYYAALMDPDDPECPIRRQAVPLAAEAWVSADDMHDPLHEDADMPVPYLTHRYPDRVLFVITEMCPMYCRHCTRRRKVGSQEGSIPYEAIDRVVDYLRGTPEVRDVLISGGDPLSLGDNKLEYILAALRSVPHIEIIRFGTRVLVCNPFRVTQELAEMISRHHPVWVNTHFNHPREITPEAVAACARLANTGVPLGNQAVLLRGVNDCPHIQLRLCHELVRARVRPYYLYQCDLSEGIEHFRTPVTKGIEIIEYLRGHTSGYAVPTFVVDAPGGGGKIPLGPQYLISMSPKTVVLRNFEGMICAYPEPEHGDTHDPARCPYCQAARNRLHDGVSQLLARQKTALEPEGLARLRRRAAHHGQPAAVPAPGGNGQAAGRQPAADPILQALPLVSIESTAPGVATVTTVSPVPAGAGNGTAGPSPARNGRANGQRNGTNGRANGRANGGADGTTGGSSDGSPGGDRRRRA